METRRHLSQSDVHSVQLDSASSKKLKKKAATEKKKVRTGSEKKNKVGGIFNFSRTKVKDSSGSSGGGKKVKVKHTLSLSREESVSPRPHRRLDKSITNSIDTCDERSRAINV